MTMTGTPSERRWDWDDPLARMPGETVRANLALRDYARMGPGRSLLRLVERYQSRSLVERPPYRSYSSLHRWSRRCGWAERAARFDELQDAALEVTWQQRRQEEREREWQVASSLLATAERLLDEAETLDWRGVDAARLADVGAKLARLAAGMTTDQTAVTVSGPIRWIEVVEDDEDASMVGARNR